MDCRGSDATSLGRAELALLCSEFADDLDRYIRHRHQYSTRSVRVSCSNTIDVTRAPIRLYLRFRPLAIWPMDSIVIASIAFAVQRKGHGKALLKFLADVSPRYGLRSIGIEQTHDGEGIQGFVEKFGFQPHKDESNWIVSIDTLKTRLAEPDD